MRIRLPKYDPKNEFETRLVQQHQWRMKFDGATEQCIICGCWDPTPVGMQPYSMAPKEYEGKV